jgi:hypothetical protein
MMLSPFHSIYAFDHGIVPYFPETWTIARRIKMDVVSLPLVFNSDTVHHALDRLKEMQRSGVVVDRTGNNFWLYFTGDLLDARAKCIKVMSEVAGGEPIHRASRDDAGKYTLDFVQPFESESGYNAMFAGVPENYALVAAGDETAILVTRHETVKDELVVTGGYECTGPTTHYFPRPSVSVGMKCPKAGCVGYVNVSR